MFTKYLKISRLNLSKRYLLIPLVLIVFLFLFFLIYNNIKKRTVDVFNNEQLILAQTAAQGITSLFNDYQADLYFFGNLPDIIDFNNNGETLMKSFCENHIKHIAGFTRVNEHGIILFTYPINESVIGNDISYQEHVQQVIKTHKTVISDVFQAVQGYQAIAMHVPVFKGSEFKGSLALLFPIHKIGERYLGKIKIRGTGNVWLFSENGIEIYCPIKGHEGKAFPEITQNDSSAKNLMEKIKNEEFGLAQSVHQQFVINGKTQFEKKHVAFYRASLLNTYWTICISYQEKDIYDELSSLRNRLILVFLLILMVVGYYFYSLTRVRNLLREVEKRKKAEKILHENEEKFRTIFEESPIGIELYDKNGLLINANKASLSMFGIPDVSEIKGFNIFDGTSLDDAKREKLRKGQPVSYQSIFDFEQIKALKQYQSAKTGKAYFDYTITPLFDQSGNDLDGYLVQIQDITERKRNEEEILMLAHALKSVNECVSITDMENKILFVNDSFLTTYGYTLEELTGKPVNILRSQDEIFSLTREILPSTLRGGWKGELVNVRKDGSEFPIYLSTTIIKDSNSKPLGLIGVASDITERKRMLKELITAKEKAEESDRLKSAFLANMSHEIRTPMNGILGFAKLMKGPDVTNDEQNQFIEIIEKSSERLLKIISNLIDISRIEAGQMEITISDTNINDQMESVYNLCKPETDQKGIEFSFRTSLPHQEAIITTDREKLYAILTNLVKNAIKYTHKGSIEFGYVSISSTTSNLPDNQVGERSRTHEMFEPLSVTSGKLPVREAGERSRTHELRFYVKDTGIGIPANRHQAIFDRFVQADIEDRNAYQGAGLGLSITKAYVEMLGGKIWVESEEGLGSTFYFTIPYNSVIQTLNDGTIKDSPQNRKAITNPTDLNLKILIAEDDEVSEIFIGTVVKMISNNILIANNGVEAVELCQKHSDIDLILMDIQLPEINGYEAIRKIREFNKNVIIIAHTAYALPDDMEKAIAAGCNNYISKPINIDELSGLIKLYF